MTDVVLGIDIGTGSTKAGLVDADGELVAVARAPHEIRTLQPDWSESSPDDWLASATQAVGEVLVQLPDAHVAAIGLSGQMHGVAFTDDAGCPVRPAVLWSDRRAGSHLERLRERLGDAAGRLANPVVSGMAGATIAVLAQTEPDVLDATVHVLQPKDWLRLQLTGEVATDPSDASATLLWDAHDDDWSAEACEAFDVQARWLPEVRGSSSAGGSVTDDAAKRLGLEPGTPVAVGAADTAAALLGAGIAVGQTQVSTGTGGQIARLLDQPVVDETRRTHLYRAAEDGRWYAMAAIQNAGIAIDWALQVLDTDLDHAERVQASAGEGTGGVVFIPFLTGERTPHLDANLTGRWVGLHSGTTRDDLLLSVFLGVAHALRDGLDALRNVGHEIDEALLAGGGSVSAGWRQLLADALGIALVPHDATDASVRGAALLGWRNLGHHVDPLAAIERKQPVAPAHDFEASRRRFHEAVAELTGDAASSS